jgi:protein-disulfide isomerase-like protein with CxxC motif
VNCTEDKPEVEALMDKFKVEGYPTFKLVSDGKVYDFDAKPTEESLVSFMKKFL